MLAEIPLHAASIQWDGAKEQIVGDAEANQLLLRPYRQPWVHPQV